MASAVLPGRNDPHYNPHFNPQLNLEPSPNPNPYQNPLFNPNFIINPRTNDLTPKTDLWQRNGPSPRPRPHPAPTNDSPSLNRSSEGPLLTKYSFHGEYVRFHLSSYSRRELKELKNRLISDLERVQTLLTRLETRKLEFTPGPHTTQSRPPVLESNSQTLDPYQASGLATRNGKGKKKQKLSGQKRARETKRPVTVMDTSSEEEKVLANLMKKFKQILMTLMKQKHSCVFNRPVDVARLKLHDYYQVIKHPMDLGTIKSKLNKRFYKSPDEFAADVRLTFNNAMIYNPKGHDVNTIAESLLSKFEVVFEPVYQEYMVAEKMRQISNCVHLEQVITVPQEPILQSEMGKLPKLKDKVTNMREMSDEEKSNLGFDLQNMPQEKMEQMVQIVRKRNPHLVQEGDEIELDFEVLDNETLWDLDRFVNYHKMKGQEIVKDVILVEEAPKCPDSLRHEEIDAEKNKIGDSGDEDVDIGEDIPAYDFPPVEIEKDVEVEKCTAAGANCGTRSSDGSGSSSDDSSSSDSDSGSSSEIDSDEESAQSPYFEPKGISLA